MDHERFDAFARGLAGLPRRAVLGGGAAGLAALAGSRVGPDAAARKRRRRKKPKKGRCKPNCADRSCGTDGCGGSCGACAASQICARGECCQPEARGATCAGRCGTWRNNCGQMVECATCENGQVCLSNGSCAITCTANDQCGACGCSNPDVEGARHCIVGPLFPTTFCKTTDDCPPQTHCQDIGAGGICIELCA
ncbi:MAG: hypothetical protein R2853_09785 [Thermomicrobiales bacterium]